MPVRLGPRHPVVKPKGNATGFLDFARNDRKTSILKREELRTVACATAVSIFAGVLYFLTAARDIVVGDSPELTMAAAILGVAHPPGYPLFTMLGHIFSLLPLGPIPFRVNLLSVICDALTVGIVFLTAFRLSQSRLLRSVAPRRD